MIRTLDRVKAFLVSKGHTAADIFLEHANRPKGDHILLSMTGHSARTDDGLLDWFDDTVRVTLTKVDSTMAVIKAERDTLISELVGLHLTDEIVKSDLRVISPPIKLGNSKSIQWIGIFQMKGCFI